MWGRATFATLVSSTSMNVARVTVSAMTHGLMAGGLIAWPLNASGAAVAEPSGRTCSNCELEFTEFMLFHELFHEGFWFDGHPKPQIMIAVLSLLEDNFHRD